MEILKPGSTNRYNERFLSKFVTNRSINLEIDPFEDCKKESQPRYEINNLKTLSTNRIKKPALINIKKSLNKSNCAVVNCKEYIRISQNSPNECMMNSIQNNYQKKNKSHSIIKENILNEDVKSREIIESNSKITFFSPQFSSKKLKVVKKLNIKKPIDNKITKIKSPKNTTSNLNKTQSIDKKKTIKMIKLKKNTVNKTTSSENNSKKTTIDTLKKPSILSSPLSPMERLNSDSINNYSKKEVNKETVGSNPNYLYSVGSNSNIYLSNSNLNKSIVEYTDKKFNTVQVEVHRASSEINQNNKGFIKNKYKNLLENFSKSKKNN